MCYAGDVLILEPVAVSHIVGQVLEHEAILGGPMILAGSEQLWNALRAASRLLSGNGIRHAVIGGIAVGVYGWQRSTRDVDLLLGSEAWERQSSGALVQRIPLPEFIDEVPIDYLPIDVAGSFLEVAFEHPQWTEGLPIAPAEVVVCTKLIRLAMRDQADIVEIVKANRIDRIAVRAFLAEHTPMLVGRWDALVTQAEAEIARSTQRR
jgi:hypothetical protein